MEIYLPRATPESLGISSGALSHFLAAVQEQIDEMHSFMLVRHGQVAAEAWWHPYAPDRPHMLFSLSKSFTSTAVGIAVAEERLTIDDPVISFFPKDLPKIVSPNLAGMKVRHLLTMSTGHAIDTTERIYRMGKKNWVKSFLSLPVENTPGAPFVYNSGATYMLSAIIQTLTGQTLLDYLRPHLFEPLGILNPTWETCPRGFNIGGWGLSITTEDIAKFGQLYLQKGIWNGQRLISEEWVQAATSKQVSNSPTNPENANKDLDWKQGYGFQFWCCQHNAYRGDGAFGQFCIVMPEQDAVLAITAGVSTMQPILNLVWQHILPALQLAPLPPHAAAHRQWEQQTSQLVFLPPQGNASTPLASKVSEKIYQLETNPVKVNTLRFEFTPLNCRIHILQGKRHRHFIDCGYGAWMEGQTTLTSRDPKKVFASGIWTDDSTFVTTIRHVETPFTQTVTYRFTNDQITVTQTMNLALGPKEGPTLVGWIIN